MTLWDGEGSGERSSAPSSSSASAGLSTGSAAGSEAGAAPPPPGLPTGPHLDPTARPEAPASASRDLSTPARALAIAAHPDDVEFQCGATLAKWAAAGCVVHHLICTDGSKGTWDVDADLAALVVTRQAEQRAAAAVLGATGEVVFLGWPDGELEAGLRQRWEIAYWIRRLQPDVVLGHDPWKRYRLHPDHRAAGLLACDGVVAARDPHFFPEQTIPHHRPTALLLFEADEPDHAETVAVEHAVAKVNALLAHESQFETTMDIDLGSEAVSAERAAFHDRILRELAEVGAAHGVERAEAFKLIDDL